MNGNLAVTNINQIITEIKKINILNENKKNRYIKNFEKLYKYYKNLSIN